MISPSIPVVLVGCGNMGRAMLSGWLRSGLEPEAIVIATGKGASPLPAESQKAALRFFPGSSALPKRLKAAAVVLAVKPDSLPEAAKDCRFLAGPETVFLSLIAGIALETLQAYLGPEARIVRAMPNTPAAVGRGATALCPGPGVSENQKTLCQYLGESTGLALWLDNESLMDAVTALSGSGPAYVFHMTEALAEAGERLGLPPNLAMALARQTVCGAGELMYQSPATPSQLRRNVTSPGGTTEAGLRVLMPELKSLMAKTLRAAEIRGEILGTNRGAKTTIKDT